MINIPKKLWQGTLMLVVAIGLIASGYYLHDWVNDNIQFKVVSVNDPDNVTSAISDRWELQLTDRKTGRVRIYDKEVLNAIYYQYRARLAYTQEDRIPPGE